MHKVWMPQGWTEADLIARTNWCGENLPKTHWFTTRALRRSYVSKVDQETVHKYDLVFCFYRKEDWALFTLNWCD